MLSVSGMFKGDNMHIWTAGSLLHFFFPFSETDQLRSLKLCMVITSIEPYTFSLIFVNLIGFQDHDGVLKMCTFENCLVACS